MRRLKAMPAVLFVIAVSALVGGIFGRDALATDDRVLEYQKTFANALGTIGTGRRGQLRAPGDSNLDYSLFKNFPITESKRLQFRAEAFNLLNHANLGAPSTSGNSPSFGVISTASDPRILQLALKLIF